MRRRQGTYQVIAYRSMPSAFLTHDSTSSKQMSKNQISGKRSFKTACLYPSPWFSFNEWLHGDGKRFSCNLFVYLIFRFCPRCMVYWSRERMLVRMLLVVDPSSWTSRFKIKYPLSKKWILLRLCSRKTWCIRDPCPELWLYLYVNSVVSYPSPLQREGWSGEDLSH